MYSFVGRNMIRWRPVTKGADNLILCRFEAVASVLDGSSLVTVLWLLRGDIWTQSPHVFSGAAWALVSIERKKMTALYIHGNGQPGMDVHFYKILATSNTSACHY